MKTVIKRLIGIFAAVFMTVLVLGQTKVYASSDVDYFDFGETVMSIKAGESKTIWFRSDYDYTYYVGTHSSSGTYCECSFASGSQNITFHIGADETVKNVFFYFYVSDSKLSDTDVHDCVEVYVQNSVTTYDNIAVSIADGKTGSLVKTGNTAMLYNENGVAMASFSLTMGNGNMQSFSIKGVVNNGSNYFDVTSGFSSNYPVISESDKAVMIANGYAGVCVNGVYHNW